MRNASSIAEIQFIFSLVSDMLHSGAKVPQIKGTLDRMRQSGKLGSEEIQVVYRIYGIERSNYIKISVLTKKLQSISKVIDYIDNRNKDKTVEQFEVEALCDLKALLKANYITSTVYRDMLDFYGLDDNTANVNFNITFDKWLLPRLNLVGENILSRQGVASGLLGKSEPLLRELTDSEIKGLIASNAVESSGVIHSIVTNYSTSLQYIYNNASKASKGLFESFSEIESLYIVFALLSEAQVEIKVKPSDGVYRIYKSSLIQSSNSHQISTSFPSNLLMSDVIQLKITYKNNNYLDKTSKYANIPIHSKVKSAIDKLQQYSKTSKQANISKKRIFMIENNMLDSRSHAITKQLTPMEQQAFRGQTLLNELRLRLIEQYNLYKRLREKNPLGLFLATSFIDDAYIVTGVVHRVATKVANNGEITDEAKMITHTMINSFESPDIQILYTIPKGLEKFRDIGHISYTTASLPNGTQVELYSLGQKYESAIRGLMQQ